MNKVAIFFSNNKGQYYIENVCEMTGDVIPKSSYNHTPTKVIDETLDWKNFELIQKELANPTTKETEIFAVIQTLEIEKNFQIADIVRFKHEEEKFGLYEVTGYSANREITLTNNECNSEFYADENALILVCAANKRNDITL